MLTEEKKRETLEKLMANPTPELIETLWEDPDYDFQKEFNGDREAYDAYIEATAKGKTQYRPGNCQGYSDKDFESDD